MANAVAGFGAREGLLNRGEMTPVLGHVLSFVGLPEAEEMPKINKAFRRATQELQVGVCSQLGLTQNAIVIAAGEKDVSCEEELQRVWGELDRSENLEVWTEEDGTAAVVSLLLGIQEAGWGGRQKMMFDRYWQRLKDLKRSAEQDAPDRRQVRMQSLLAQLKPLREQIDATLIQYSRGVRGAEDQVPRLFSMLQHTIARENVSERFRNVITEKGLDSQNGRACLAALSEKQRAAAAFTPFHLREFEQAVRHHPAFSSERFIEAESVAVAAEMAGEEDYLLFWEAIISQFNNLHIQVLEDEMPHTSAEILRWLDNPANQERLDRIERLRINGLRHLPSRIEKLRNLRDLDCMGSVDGRKLSNLPPELGNLVHLRELGLYQNLLVEIPEIIRRLPELRMLGLTSNPIREIPLFLTELREHLEKIYIHGNPIRVLPEEIYRAFIYKPLFVEKNLFLDEGSLEQMPFSLWFRQAGIRMMHFWISFVERPITEEIYKLHPLYAIPSIIIGCCIKAALFVPWLLLSSLLYYFVEPIASFLWDACGFDPMVDVEPLEDPWAGAPPPPWQCVSVSREN